MKRNALIKMVQFSILLALEVIMCFTPLGSIPIGPMVATLAMIPVILTGILLGVGAGAAMGFFAGLFSFYCMDFHLARTNCICFYTVCLHWRYSRQRLEPCHLFYSPYFNRCCCSCKCKRVCKAIALQIFYFHL